MKITLNELRNLIKSVIKEETQRMKELTVILNFKKSLIQFEDDFGDIFDEFEFEPYDGTIDADFNDMQSSLSDYFRKGMSSNVNVTVKTISYEGNEIKELESNDNINSFNELIRFITDSSEEFDAFLASKPIIKKVKNLVDELNQLINVVNPMFENSENIHGVEDSSSTWGTSYIYEPITFNENEGLTITSTDVHSQESDIDKIKITRLEFDGIPTLQNIKKMYNQAKKKLEIEKMKKDY
jgi:hypothetical protein